MCLGKTLKSFAFDNEKKTGLSEYVYDFFVDYNTIYINDIVDIHKYLIKKYNITEYVHLLRKCLLRY